MGLPTAHGSTLAATVCLALVGCGRLGYDALGDPLGDAGDASTPGDDAAVLPACSPGAAYSRPVIVSNDGPAALDDYQVHVVVDTSGLVAAGKMMATCADVAFVDAITQARLPHWLQSGCGTNATSFWLRVGHLPAGSTRLAMTYGDAAATSTSDGSAVFLLFDAFDDGNTAGWTAYQRNQDAGDGAFAQTASTADAVSPAYSLELRGKAACFTPPFDGLAVGMRRSEGLPAGDYSLELEARAAVLAFQFNTSASSDLHVRGDGVELLSRRLAQCSGQSCTAVGLWTSVALPLAQLALGTLELELGAGDCVTGVLWLDDVRIRRTASPEPTAAVVGVESSCP